MKHPRDFPRWLRVLRVILVSLQKNLDRYEVDKARHADQYRDRLLIP